MPAVHSVAAKWVAVQPDDLELHVWHAIRQFYEADGGSGFGPHQDDADDCINTENIENLLLSAAVKLSLIPPDSDGSSMQVLWPPCPQVKYGAGGGSVIMFAARSVHASRRTPLNMGKVYKIVFFFRKKKAAKAAKRPAREPPKERPKRGKGK